MQPSKTRRLMPTKLIKKKNILNHLMSAIAHKVDLAPKFQPPVY
jgi:hypothetical protein